MKLLVLCAILVYSGGLVKADGLTGCEVTEAAIAELEELKTLVDQLTTLVETIIGGPIPEPEPFVIIDPVLTFTWKEAKLTWTPPDGVIGYTATLTTPEGDQPLVRLSPFAESFTTTDITVGEEYTIKIIPIKGDGPGETFISEVFVPVCPMICTFDFRPQCGTDGITYSNPCALEIAQCEGSDESLELAYEGPCDPCFNVQCTPPECSDGFVVGSTPPPGECCVVCVDECSVTVCPTLQCQPGFVETDIEGECCPECVVEDPCFNVQCTPPQCPDGFVVGSTPPPGECCVGCVDECAGTVCPTLQCQPGFVETNIEGECCPECVVEVFADCSAALTSGKITSGKYMLQPAGAPAPFEAVCDMVTDGGGWTVILVRDSTGGNFYRDMADYVAGFGDLDGSHWLGLENLYLLNKQGNVEMLVQVTDQSGVSDVATYRNFRINNADTDYTLETVSGFRGGAGNALFYNKGAPFSARDMDNDGSVRNCAEELVGGWWYKGGMCSRSNPLGEYRTRTEFEVEKGIFWAPFRGKKHSLSNISMKIRDPTA
ncbi:Tenascin [Holothuria leucospilota]|uniref:Tenascin n=1 Tax=Holothuria leucospilota TaxID=206669 RepID=A0A9Q1BEG7_HOLLE|nr:Tenascin [Holothuria leucospilota]